jgi:hypothetical protein
MKTQFKYTKVEVADALLALAAGDGKPLEGYVFSDYDDKGPKDTGRLNGASLGDGPSFFTTHCGYEHCWKVEEVEQTDPGYGYTLDGELISAEAGYFLLSEGVAIENGDMYFSYGQWRPSLYLSRFTTSDYAVRVYARKVPVLAKGHNPDNLTEGQVGVADGWRLLAPEEIMDRPPTLDIQVSGTWDHWFTSGYCGNLPLSTYRTKKPEGFYLKRDDNYFLLHVDGKDYKQNFGPESLKDLVKVGAFRTGKIITDCGLLVQVNVVKRS